MEEQTKLFETRYAVKHTSTKQAQPKKNQPANTHSGHSHQEHSTLFNFRYAKQAPHVNGTSGQVPVLQTEGIESRLNTPTNFVVPPEYLNRRKPQFLVGEITRIEQIHLHPEKYIDQDIVVAGWAHSARLQAADTLLFVELVDGSTPTPLQIVITKDAEHFEELKKIKKSYSLRVKGKLIKSLGKGQAVEISITGSANEVVKILGRCDDDKYPLGGKFFKPEYLREIAHLRPRTQLIGCMSRVKNSLAYATHLFFQNNGFLYVKTPLITTSDCEGAGAMFQVTTILPKSGKIKDIPQVNGKIDYGKEFFKKVANLTVSGQLAVENYCCALSNVYTFGPTFRAEVSHTTRHISEFWMIEPQLAFADMFDVMECAEAYIKYCIEFVLSNNMEDLKFLADKVKKGLIEYLQAILAGPFARASYTQAITILEDAIKTKGAKFQNEVKWGVDLASEHEKYLCDKIFFRPTILYNYPKDIKAFYMRLNEDGKTVASFDVLAPEIGEIVGGSQREERLDVLQEKIESIGLNKDDYWWYLDLRRYGTVPHGGFGLGFERLVMMCTGIENIRDVVPFPRVPGNAEF